MRSLREEKAYIGVCGSKRGKSELEILCIPSSSRATRGKREVLVGNFDGRSIDLFKRGNVFNFTAIPTITLESSLDL